MAFVYPTMENISRMKVRPTEGEMYLLKFLKDNLDDKYEVYFQPFLNGDNPDIILVNKEAGAMIIEVKDWNLNNYIIDDNKKWRLRRDGTYIKSPIEQVQCYKENMFNLHIDKLLEMQIRNKAAFSIIKCAVYFHNANKKDIDKFVLGGFQGNNSYIKYIKNFELMGRDSLTKDNFQRILQDRWLNRKSNIFNEEIYNSLKRYLQPPMHRLEEGKEIIYTKKQRQLIISQSGEQKIKGVAGSGKTLVLARRAVNAHKRTGKRVLILCFNIVLKNYIHEKISEVREEFSWEYFYINNYHDFIRSELNNLGVSVDATLDTDNKDRWEYLNKNYYGNEKLFKDFEGKIQKYDAIFIDEVQDYEIEWLRILKNIYLAKNGEFVVFGDEKQNVYDRKIDRDRRPITNIQGRWNELNESFRLSEMTAEVAIQFQKYFFKEKYLLDEIKILNHHQTSIFEMDSYLKEHIKYTYFNKNEDISVVYNEIHKFIQQLNVHPNDVCILGARIELLTDLDYLIRKNRRERTRTSFETKEMKEMLMKQNNRNLKLQLDKIRRNKKFSFWSNCGTIKLSTIHSFKGSEVHTLFLIIEDNQSSEAAVDELIYTGITRCRNNLIIINIGNGKYHDFFQKTTSYIEKLV